MKRSHLSRQEKVRIINLLAHCVGMCHGYVAVLANGNVYAIIWDRN